MRSAFFAIILAMFAASPAWAQREGPPPANPADDWGWTSFGIGSSDPYDFSAFLSVNYGRERFAQLMVSDLGYLLCSGPTCAGVTSVGLGAGRSWVDRPGRVAVSGGLAAGNYRLNTGDPGRITAGVYANLQFAATPIKEFGFGFDLFAQTYGTDGLLGAPQIGRGLRVTFVFEGNK